MSFVQQPCFSTLSEVSLPLTLHSCLPPTPALPPGPALCAACGQACWRQCLGLMWCFLGRRGQRGWRAGGHPTGGRPWQSCACSELWGVCTCAGLLLLFGPD